MEPLHLIVPLLTGFLVSVVLTPLIIRLAHRNNWYDDRNHRKIHVHDTPRIGGIAILVGFLASIGAAIVVHRGALEPGGVTDAPGILRSLGPILGGMLVIHAMGLVDDFRNLRAALKLALQVVAAGIVLLGPFRIERLTVPFVWYQLELGAASYPVTVLWIVAVSNALNFIDGVDGLAGGVSAIAALFFGIIAVIVGSPFTAILAFGLAGSVIAFLVFNRPPARIFMGDSGAYLLGFVLAVLPLLLTTGSARSLNLVPGLTLLAVPLLDMSSAVMRRVHRGKHPMVADREHIHHKLIDVGLRTWQILLVAYGATGVAGVVAVLWYVLPLNADMVVVLVAWAIALSGLAWLKHRLRGKPDRIPESAQ